jgi:DNA-binding MarR family transcriptional regulator
VTFPYDDPRLTAMGLLTEASSGLRAVLAPQIAAHGLSDTEFEVLLRLARTPGQRLRMTDLAAQTSLSTSGITRVVDRLEREGLVERRSCATDRRGYWATLTPVGDARLAAAVTGHVELVDRWLTSRLTDDQLAGLVEALRIVRDGVRPDALAGVGTRAAEATEPAAGAAGGR